jgi:hypothetical protein
MTLLYDSQNSSRLRSSLLVIGLAAAMIAPGKAGAAIIITQNVDNTGTDNVLFNIGGLLNDANTVQGVVNNAANTLVDFTAAAGSTFHANGGQARIEGPGGAGAFRFLQLEMHSGETFTKLVWNLNTPNGAGTGTVTFTIDGVDFPTVFNIGNGQNFFTFTASGGMTMTTVAYNTTVDIQDTRQIRVGGVSTPTTTTSTTGTTGGTTGTPPPAIPEPESYLLTGLGLTALYAARRRGKF